MGRHRHFHSDLGSHSITVNIHSGHTSDVALLVDGKELAHQQVRGSGTSVLTAELPDDPAHPVRVRVHQPWMGYGAPSCFLEVDGAEEPMDPRAM